MTKYCLLKPPYNHCIYHDGKDRCTAEFSTCGMQVKLDCNEKQSLYVRKDRWYEQYYAKN